MKMYIRSYGIGISVGVELGADDDLDLLVEGARASETEFISVPVEADDRLLCHDLLIEELDAACDTHGQIVLILDCAAGRVVILVKVESTVATHGCEKVTILREMAHTPDSGVMGKLGKARVALFWMVRLHVEDVELGLKSRHYELVHVDVSAVKFEPANTIRHVGVPTEAVRAEIEQLDIAIVVTSSQASLLLVKRVAKGHSPAIRLDRFVRRRLQAHDWRLLPRVPDSDAAIRATSDELRGAKLSTLATNTVNRVAHVSVGLHAVLLCSAFNVVDNELSLVIDSGAIANTHR